MTDPMLIEASGGAASFPEPPAPLIPDSVAEQMKATKLGDAITQLQDALRGKHKGARF